MKIGNCYNLIACCLLMMLSGKSLNLPDRTPTRTSVSTFFSSRMGGKVFSGCKYVILFEICRCRISFKSKIIVLKLLELRLLFIKLKFDISKKYTRHKLFVA